MDLSLACPDWEDRIRAARSLIPEGAKAINPAESSRAVSIFNKLCIPDVPGTPSFAEAGGDWFREIVGSLLGSIDPVSGSRLIRELFLMVAKKNSKTTGGAGLMLTALLMNQRPRVKFLLTGPTQEVSDLAFDQAVGMIENDPAGFLQKRMHIQGHLKTISDRRTKAELRIKTFDMSVAVGALPAGVLFDELHEISKNSKASRIIGQLRGGMLPNPEAFLAFITTQSDEPPAGAFKAELQMARAIRDGRTNGRMLPVLYEFPLAIVRDRGHPPAWQDPANWPMVTPNNGRSITISRLVEDFEMAKLKGDEEIRRWASQHLNIEIGVGLQSDAWPGAAFWESNADPTLTLDAIMERSEIVVVGIDGGGLDDLLGLAVLGREKVTRNWLHWGHAWAHESVLERRKDIAATLRDFEADGDLTVVKRVGDDVQEVADIVEQLESARLLPEKIAVGVDQAGISEIVDELSHRGIAPERVGGVPQGWKLNNAIKTTERKLAGGALKHGGSRLMAWTVGNAKAEARGNAITITKQAAGSAKIDPLMALFDAVVAMGLNPEARGSYLETADLLVI
jgi:phage terminase large subunit-like protein